MRGRRGWTESMRHTHTERERARAKKTEERRGRREGGREGGRACLSGYLPAKAGRRRRRCKGGRRGKCGRGAGSGASWLLPTVKGKGRREGGREGGRVTICKDEKSRQLQGREGGRKCSFLHDEVVGDHSLDLSHTAQGPARQQRKREGAREGWREGIATYLVMRQINDSLQSALLLDVVVGDDPLCLPHRAQGPSGEVDEEGGGGLKGQAHALGGEGQEEVDAAGRGRRDGGRDG